MQPDLDYYPVFSRKERCGVIFYLDDFELEQLLLEAANKIVPLDYEGAVMAFADSNPEGIALLKKPISADELNQFSHTLIKGVTK